MATATNPSVITTHATGQRETTLPINENGRWKKFGRGVSRPGKTRSPKTTRGGTSTKVMLQASSIPAPPSRPNWLKPRKPVASKLP